MTVEEDDGRLWTAAELEQLAPEEYDALMRRRHRPITDLTTLPPAFVERIRATAERLAAEYAERDEADEE